VKLLSRRTVWASALCTGVAALPLLGVGALVAFDDGAPLAPDVKPVARAARAPSVLLRGGSGREEWAVSREGHPAAVMCDWTPDGLILGVDTKRTSAGDEVHAVLARTKRAIPVGAGLRFRARLDARPPENGSYRSAGLLVTADQAPSRALDALRPAVRIEVVGVPPGNAARLSGSVLDDLPRSRSLFEDGWPARREGRAIEKVTLAIEVRRDSLVLFEDGREVGRAPRGFSGEVFVVLYATSHANYPARPVVFEEVVVEPIEAGRPGGSA
jgi:hypothetical protein